MTVNELLQMLQTIASDGKGDLVVRIRDEAGFWDELLKVAVYSKGVYLDS